MLSPIARLFKCTTWRYHEKNRRMAKMSATTAETKRTAKKEGDVMLRNVVTVPADATLQEVATLLTTNHISGAPVVDENGQMIGIISEGDILSESRRRAGLPHVAAFGLFFVPQETLEKIYHHG